MIKKMMPVLTLLVLLSAASLSLWAQPAAAPEKDGARDALIAQLVEMPREERRAFLQNMSQEERDGLWFLVQRELHPASGSATLTRREIEIDRTFEGPALNGTIQYDSGFPTVAFTTDNLVGNRFDTHHNDGNTNQVPATGTVSTIRALVVPGSASASSSAGFVMLGPQTTGGGAMALFSAFGGASGLVDSIEFAGLGVTYTGSEFFVVFGAFSSVYVPAFGTETTMGQGHHGVTANTGMMGPNVTSITGFTSPGPLNSFIRATGAIVPVELMSFEIE